MGDDFKRGTKPHWLADTGSDEWEYPANYVFYTPKGPIDLCHFHMVQLYGLFMALGKAIAIVNIDGVRVCYNCKKEGRKYSDELIQMETRRSETSGSEVQNQIKGDQEAKGKGKGGQSNGKPGPDLGTDQKPGNYTGFAIAIQDTSTDPT